MKHAGSCLIALLLANVAVARTVALWPLNWDAANNTIDGRCAIDAANDLSGDTALVYNGSLPLAPGWTLPPNPDATGTYLFDPTNATACFSMATSAARNYAYSGTVGRNVTADKDFTLEGFCRFPEIPAAGGLFFVADCDGMYSTGRQRWFLTLRTDTKGTVTWQLFAEAHGTGDRVLCTLTAAEALDITRGWHHFALSLEHRTAEDKAIWRFYQDGDLRGAITNAAFAGTVNTSGYFGFGGRNNPGNVFKGAISYCRLSDDVLPPERFLNYSEAFTPVTKGLWKLDRTADGGVNGAPTIGVANFSGGFLNWKSSSSAAAQYSDSLLSPDPDCAFTGNPPNTTVTLPTGNGGSLQSRIASVRTTMRVDDLGRDLSLTNDFTVEGWVKPEWHETAGVGTYHHLCGTRITTTAGWVLQLTGTPGTPLAVSVHAEDGVGPLFSTPPTLGSLAGYESRWTHLALVYDHAAGDVHQGVWNFYRDGVFCGCATNAVAPRDGGVAADGRFKFGTMTAAMSIFPGKMDCWRVSKAALRPEQLLCTAENCEAATDVLAFWPLNASHGAYADGTDVVGAYSFNQIPAVYQATGCEGAPEVPGISSSTNGSAGFRVSEESPNAYLFCNYANVVGTLSSVHGCTFEVYFRRTAAPTSANEFLYLAYPDGVRGLGNQGTLCANLNYSTAGLKLFVRNVMSGDMTFKDAAGNPVMLPQDTWTHLAITTERNGTAHTYTLYLNGERRAAISSSGTAPIVPTSLFLGGRPSSAQSFRGQLSCLRITEGVLEAGQFLCSNEVDTSTFAYWPLDYVNGVPDLSGRVRSVEGVLGLSKSGTVTGSATGARGSVPRPDADTAFVGNAKLNAGSVSLKDGVYLAAPGIGPMVDTHAPFTVEGWLRWPNTRGAAEETIVGTYRALSGTESGWKLVLDSTGTKPMLRIVAKGPYPMGVLVDGVLLGDASTLKDAWRHLALRYDPAVGNGEWSLLLDGMQVGTAQGATRFSSPCNEQVLRLGSVGQAATAFTGDFDMWRVKGGVLERGELLWAHPAGTLLLVR